MLAGRFEPNPRKVIVEYFRERKTVIFYYLILLTVPSIVALFGFGLVWGLVAGIRSFGSAIVSQNFTLSLLLDWAEIGAAFLAIIGLGTLLFFALWRSEATVGGLSARYWENREARLIATLEAFVHLSPFYNEIYVVGVSGFALLAFLLIYLGFGKLFVFGLAFLLIAPLFVFSHALRYYFLNRPPPDQNSQPVSSSAESPLIIHLLATILKSRVSRFTLGFIVFPLLIGVSLLWPIFTGVQALMTFEADRISNQASVLRGTGGIQLTFPADSMARPFWFKAEAIERTTFLEGEAGPDLLMAAESIPAYLLLQSPFFRFHFQGTRPQQVRLTIPISPDVETHQTLDLYTWDGQRWQWLPSQKNKAGTRIETTLSFAPHSIAVMEALPRPPKLSSNYRPNEPLPEQAKDNLSELHPQNFLLGEDGTITLPQGPPPEFLVGTVVDVLPSLGNQDEEGTIQTGQIEVILQNQRLRERHIQNILDFLDQGDYQGIDLHYIGLETGLRQAYTDFLADLRQALPADKQLFVHLDFPRQLDENTWDTGGYDWVAIGALADVVKIDLAPQPDAYAEGRQMEALLDWAVGRVNRYKLQPTLRTQSAEFIGGTSQPITLAQALSHLGTVTLVEELDTIKTNQTVELTFSGLQAGIHLDLDTGIYVISYQDDTNREHLIYLENAATVFTKLQFLAQYNLRGVHLQNLLEREIDTRVWRVIQEFPGLVVPPLNNRYRVLWQAEHETGVVINQDFLDLSDPVYNWLAPRVGGVYTISAGLRTEQIADGTFSLGSLPLDVKSPPPPTSQPSPTPAASPTPTVGPSPTPTLTPTPTATPLSQSVPAPTIPLQPTVEDTCRPRGEFADLWAANEEAFGCPIESAPLYGTFVEMSFEHGYLYWMQNIDRYGDVGLAIATLGGRNPGDSGTWSLQQENWNGEGICPVGPPPEGLFLPDRNLAQIWCDMNGLDVLGYATIPQQIVANQGEAAIQNFDNVILLKDKQGHEQNLVYILSRADNSYRRVAY